MKRQKLMTEGKYYLIKRYLVHNSVANTAEYYQYSAATIAKISRTNTWEAYQKLNTDLGLAAPKKAKAGKSKTSSQLMPEKFRQTKVLLAKGVGTSEIAKMLNIGRGTVWLFKMADTFEDYQTKARETREKYLKPIVSPAPEVEETKIETLNPHLVEKVEEAENMMAKQPDILATLKQTNVLLGELLIELRAKNKRWF